VEIKITVKIALADLLRNHPKRSKSLTFLVGDSRIELLSTPYGGVALPVELITCNLCFVNLPFTPCEYTLIVSFDYS
jgi:hypothetical protein